MIFKTLLSFFPLCFLGASILDTMPESSNQETDSTALLEIDSSNTAIIPETGQLTLEGFSLSVPADQMRMIHNINTLIAEVDFVDYLCDFLKMFSLAVRINTFQFSRGYHLSIWIILLFWLQLAIEKEELVQALSSELSRSAHVKVH